MRKLSITAAVATIPLVLSGIAGAAMADDVSNNLDNTVDAAAEIMPLNVGGAVGTTSLRVVMRDNDGKDGCNITGNQALTLAVSSSNTAVATVSPSSVTFNNCDDAKLLTVTPVGQGSSTVGVTIFANSVPTVRTFNLAPATFRVDVAAAAPSNTAPRISVAGVTGGASYTKGAVPAATCQVTDAEDGNSSFAAALSAVSGAYSADGIGSQTASCSYTDAGGLTATASETYGIVDATAPVITYTVNPGDPDGLANWYRSNVTLVWDVSEPDSPSSLVLDGCTNQSVTSDQAATEYTCAASSAGGPAAQQSVSIKRDATAPTVSNDGVVGGTPGSNGWYTSDVTVKFSAVDALSGPGYASDTVVSSGEGSAVSVESPAFSDLAGNTTAAGAASDSYKIDQSAPVLDVTGGPSAGTHYYGYVPGAPSCSATDAVSGLNGTCSVSGYGTGIGSHSWSASASDMAGNRATSSPVAYDVLGWRLSGFFSPVDMSGVWNSVKGGATVPLKFKVFAGQTELTQTSAVTGFAVKQVSCATTAPVDDVEFVTTGGTSLRYDATGGQFIQNWQTPKKPGTCHQVTVSLQDGSSTSAKFMLK